MHDRLRPIGIFDSGVGGLTVLAALRKLLPHEQLIYLGDTANFPYGPRSSDSVRRLALRNAHFLGSQGIKMLVVACNTASAVALEEISISLPIPSLGVIKPGAAAGVATTRNRKLGIIGTERTIQSQAYTRAVSLLDPAVSVFTKACPLFVPLVEEGWTEGHVPYEVALHYLSGMKNKDIDTLVLGCTHYPLLRNVVSQGMGPDVMIVDSAESTAAAVKEVLDQLDLHNDPTRAGGFEIFVTDAPEKLAAVGTHFLGTPLTGVQKIDLL